MQGQLEMFSTNHIDLSIQLTQFKTKLTKIQRQQEGLFKRLGELKKDSDFILGQIEDIEHHHIYGNS